MTEPEELIIVHVSPKIDETCDHEWHYEEVEGQEEGECVLPPIPLPLGAEDVVVLPLGRESSEESAVALLLKVGCERGVGS